jgi:hypothetical protein
VGEDPKVGRKFEFGEIERLEGLEGGKSDESFLREGAVEKSSDLLFGSVVLDRLSEVTDGGRSRSAKRRISDEGGEEISDHK